MFGGRDELGPKNKLYVLRVGQKPCEWIEPNVEGRAPMARYGHSITHYPEKNILILFGGRNDDNYISTGESYLNDVWILTLDRLAWFQWDREDRGAPPVPRYSHCAVALGTSVIVFGGLSEDNYCRSDIYALDMEEPKGRQTGRRFSVARCSVPTVTTHPQPVQVQMASAASSPMVSAFEETKLFSPREPIALSRPVSNQNSFEEAGTKTARAEARGEFGGRIDRAMRRIVEMVENGRAGDEAGEGESSGTIRLARVPEG